MALSYFSPLDMLRAASNSELGPVLEELAALPPPRFDRSPPDGEDLLAEEAATAKDFILPATGSATTRSGWGPPCRSSWHGRPSP